MEEYFNRQKTLGFCQACPNFARYWSCPPYAFDEAIFLKQFKYMHIIGRQFEVPRDDLRNIRDPQAVVDYSTKKLEAIKVMTWKTLLEIENEVDGAIALIPGNCPICETQGLACARKENKACRYPGMMRFSLESLGFNVMDLLKYEVGMTMKWGDTYRLPEVLTSVSAILCNEEIPKAILKKYFPDKKKSWERDKHRAPVDEFQVSEVIKPEETIHGGRAAASARARIIDDEMPAYRPKKSWVGYKAEKNPEDEAMKKGYTVTIQGEETAAPEMTAQEVEAQKIYDEDAAPEAKAEEVLLEEVAIKEVAEPEAEMAAELEEEDDSKYQWLGFKANLDDDEIVKRPIPKMTELILEGEEIAAEDAATEPPVDCVPDLTEQEMDLVVAAEALAEPVDNLADAAEVEEMLCEDDDCKYQWLGFKANLNEEEETIVTKSTLASLVIPE